MQQSQLASHLNIFPFPKPNLIAHLFHTIEQFKLVKMLKTFLTSTFVTWVIICYVTYVLNSLCFSFYSTYIVSNIYQHDMIFLKILDFWFETLLIIDQIGYLIIYFNITIEHKHNSSLLIKKNQTKRCRTPKLIVNGFDKT